MSAELLIKIFILFIISFITILMIISVYNERLSRIEGFVERKENERNVFIYWVGKDYKLIKILRQLMLYHSNNGSNYTLHFINDKNINDYLTDIPEVFNKLCPAHQADYVRVNLIYKYGGIWLDSDTIVMDDLGRLFDIFNPFLSTTALLDKVQSKESMNAIGINYNVKAEQKHHKHDGFFINEDWSISNGVFGSKKGTLLMKYWKTKIDKILENNTDGKLEWIELGGKILVEIRDKRKYMYDNYKFFSGKDDMYPVMPNDAVGEYIKKDYNNHKNLERDFQPLIILVNAVYNDVEKYSIEEIINSNMPINYFINKSLETAGKTKSELLLTLNNNIRGI
jgi:hypothetical protein